MSEFIKIASDAKGVCFVTLDRSEKHNAFNADLITELTLQLKTIQQDPSIRIVILTGAGMSFSSGADLNWMRSMVNFDLAHNRADALKLAELLRLLYELKQPTLARVNGSAFGGALGLIACCDFAIACDQATFAFTEVKLGLVPAVISPYIVRAIGARRAKQLFLTGEKFTGRQACLWGLVDAIVPRKALDQAVADITEKLLQGGPIAQQHCKQLAHNLAKLDSEVERMTTELIAELRISVEGQEGMAAVLEKRKPNWLK